MPKTKTIQGQVDSSYEKLSKSLRRSTELTGNQKILYTYMLDKFMFFSSRGQEFYESGETLAYEIGIARSNVKSCLAALIKAGLVHKITRKKKGAMLECIYSVEDKFGLYSPKPLQELDTPNW